MGLPHRSRVFSVAVHRGCVALSAEGAAADGVAFESSATGGFTVDSNTVGGNAGEPWRDTAARRVAT